MATEQGKEVQTCLVTHNVRLEMQMAELAMSPPALLCQAWSRRVKMHHSPNTSLYSIEALLSFIFFARSSLASSLIFSTLW